MAEASWVLYSTSSCHLCEQAEALLMTVELPLPVVLDVIDISEDETLVERYGKRIPVLVRIQPVSEQGTTRSEQGASGSELDWPFTAAQASAFMQQSQASKA